MDIPVLVLAAETGAPVLGMVTTDRAESSYGQGVLVVDGEVRDMIAAPRPGRAEHGATRRKGSRAV